MPDPTKKLKEVVLNIQMEPYIKAMLLKIHNDTGKPMAQILREMIEARYRHAYNNEPHCVDCGPCKCPSMHAVVPTQRITAEELVRTLDALATNAAANQNTDQNAA